MKYKLLVLTDHSTQSKENSIFALLQAMRTHPFCAQIDVASRGLSANQSFFFELGSGPLYACKVTEKFSFTLDGKYFTEEIRPVELGDYDALFLRLPPPLEADFLKFLSAKFPDQKIINRPSGLLKTASKAFLLRFPEVCPEMRLCESPEEIKAFSEKFPIVLKPLRNYGGKGIVKITDGQVEVDANTYNLEEFLHAYAKDPTPYLAMKFLRNVGQGDKRIIVVNNEILGGVLRLPPPGAWLCNAAQGGRSAGAELSPEEHQIAAQISPVLQQEGIVMFGFDTLVDDDGRRVLSEINTLSIGGLPQMGQLNQQDVVGRAAKLLWQFLDKFNKKNYETPNNSNPI